MEIKQHTPNQWIKGEIKREIRKYLVINEYDNTVYQNFEGRVKAVLREKFIFINAYIKKKKKI